MADDVHDLGDERDLRITLTVGGVPTDPTALTFRMLEPDGVTTIYTKDIDAEIEAVETGTWRVLWVVRKAGRHHARFRATGAVNQCESVVFFGLRDADGSITL
jgi:hypothetical protein